MGTDMRMGIDIGMGIGMGGSDDGGGDTTSCAAQIVRAATASRKRSRDDGRV
jgi:hypothetical protein